MNDRLSQIDTLWSMVNRAHREGSATQAQQQLLDRYGSAIRRYLVGKLRDQSAADDVFQEFALKFLRGDLYQATPEKGRFRTFLRSILFRMIADYYRAQKRSKSVPLEPDLSDLSVSSEDTSGDDQFSEVWRDEMLKRSWDELLAAERESGKLWHTVLQHRVKHPEMRSAELATSLSDRLGRPITTANVRVLLHRAREKFSALLINTIGDSLPSRSYESIEQELADLSLLEFCHASLEKLKQAEADS